MSSQLDVLIVDDEGPARRRLWRLLAAMPGVRVVGEAATGIEALARTRDLRPDLVLLDIQMPELDGFGVATKLAFRPLVVFVTAFAEFALRAYDVPAVDYVLKPVARERLARAIDRARALRDAGSPAVFPSLLPVRSQGRIDLVDVGRIDWLEAADNYVVVHAGRQNFVARGTLTDFESQLDPKVFARIHRGAIVRIDRVVTVEVAGRGDYVAILADGSRLPVSRTRRHRLI